MSHLHWDGSSAAGHLEVSPVAPGPEQDGVEEWVSQPVMVIGPSGPYSHSASLAHHTFSRRWG